MFQSHCYVFLSQLTPVFVRRSGFDAAKGDLIGDCLLTPECYFLMTRSLMTVLNRDRTAVVVALEGGYNLSGTTKRSSQNY